ncbi:MAG: site-specific recombinase [Gemmatimonadetes bacterium]|nr:site-specific recombinase [Gemmatimonadota bacterium]
MRSSRPRAMRFTDPHHWTPRLVRVVEMARSGSEVEALRLVVDGLRPSRDEAPGARVEALAVVLGQEHDTATAARETLTRLVHDLPDRSRVFAALSQSGIPDAEGFLTGLTARIGRRLLPPVPDPDDLRDLMRTVFHDPRDHVWVAAVPDASARRLMAALGLTAESFPGVGEELALAIRVLARQVAGLGTSPEITDRLPHLVDENSPFLRLDLSVERYLTCFDNGVEGDEETLLAEVLERVRWCRAEIDRLRTEKPRHGTSLHLTGLSFRLLALLDRLELLLHLTEPVERDFQTSAVALFRELLRAEKTRDHLGPHLRASADLLAFEVVEHAARKGSKYITTGRRDYGRFLVSSMGGGLLVALFALGKVAMGHWEVPLGVEALLYGINYSLCFVLIYLTGATLATKQPAMTANTVARSLGKEGHDLSGLEDLVVRVWRSQFVSFLGNLVVALPVAMLLARGVLVGSGGPVVEPDYARYMLADLHPWRSGSVIYAMVAGVLLFAAGLVSGWVDNLLLHRGVPARVEHHPMAVRAFGSSGAARLAATMERTLGVVVGNVLLGFGLGSMGTIGEILGLPLDIRHIAFASAQFGTALDVLDYRVAPGVVAVTALGVALIGLLNFLVSFGLSLAVALESRRVTFGETRELVAHLLGRLWRRPLDWFFPPREPALES